MIPASAYIKKPCVLNDLSSWFEIECQEVPELSMRNVLLEVARNLPLYVRWAKRAELLLKGCDRTRENAQKQRYHKFPADIRLIAKAEGVKLDSRSNGPAIAAYLLAGGERPERYSGRHKWSIHHIYNDKFPYPGRAETIHAVKHAEHFTQSAGLVAIHPIADQMCDEYPFFSWLLRAEAYNRFGYDPDGVFNAGEPDPLGFTGNRITTIRFDDTLSC